MVLENVREMWTEVAVLFTYVSPNIENICGRFCCPLFHLIRQLLHQLQVPKTGKGKKKALPVNKDRFISKMFLRGDSVIIVLRNPK